MSRDERPKKMNWATELNVHDEEKDNKLLSKMRSMEKSLIRKGYRWYSIKDTYKVLIPCDEWGHPTEEGLRKIEKHKEMLNIV